MKYPFWVTGFSAVSVSGTPTNAQLDLMLSDSAPNSTVGVEVLSATPPDVVTYPDLIRSRWVKLDGSGNKTGDFYYHDGTSWQQEEARLVDGANLVDASVPITKLSAEGGDPFDFIQVNSTGKGFQFVSTIALNKLQASIDGNFIYNNAGTWIAANFAAAVENFVYNFPFDVSQIGDRDTTGLANQVVYLTAPSSGCAFAYVETLLRTGQTPTNKLTIGAANAGKFVKVNSTGSDFEYTSTVVTAYTQTSNLPTAVGWTNGVPVDHGYGSTPFKTVKVTLIASGADAQYANGDEIDAALLNQSPSSVQAINLVRNSAGECRLCLNYISSIGVPQKEAGAFAVINPLLWNFKVVITI